MILLEFQIHSESNSATQNLGKAENRQTTQRFHFVFFIKSYRFFLSFLTGFQRSAVVIYTTEVLINITVSWL